MMTIPSWLTTAAIAVGVVLVGVQTWLRLRRVGAGPSMGWVPPALRPGLNRRAEQRGWPKPYDDEGRLIPLSERRASADRSSDIWSTRITRLVFIIVAVVVVTSFVLEASGRRA